MALAYFDSSAYIKLIVEEEASDLAAALWDGCDAALSSRLAYPEVRAALAAASEEAWEGFWASTRAVELTPTVTLHAGRLAGEHSRYGTSACEYLTARCQQPSPS